MLRYYTSVLLLCWSALAAMCILVHENDRIPRDDKRLFYLCFGLIAASALAEWCGVQFDGRMDHPRWALRLVKCADYILTPAAGGILILPMRMKNRWQKALFAILAVNAAFQLLSVPGGWMVTIDEQNHYTHGPLFAAYLAVCLVIIGLMIVQFALYGETFKRQNRNSLYTVMLLVVLGILLQEKPNGSRTAYLGMTLGAALMFIHYTEFTQLAADETLSEQRIQLMLSQIKPHFLYNTLGSIEALCDRDPKAAKHATRKFSKYLRGNMNSLNGQNMIPFETELQHTQLYLELEQIRFGDALRVEYRIGTRAFSLPPLTLEPIVENAVKHGVRKKPDGRGTVIISSRETADWVELTITDDGPGFDPAAVPDDGESHIGLRNVRERLDKICRGTLTIDSAPGRGTVATIKIPNNSKYGGGKTVLIYAIDDEPNMLYLLHEAIAEAAPDAEIRDYALGSDAADHIGESGERPDVIFSDIQMPGLSGLELAARLKELAPETKLVFVTGYDYALNAYRLHVNGYISKPVEAERVREELAVLFPVESAPERLQVRCFGQFEVFWKNEPLSFSRKRTKELFAYLVDRRGALCSTGEIAAALWEDADDNTAKHGIWNLTSDLRAGLKAVGMEDVLVSKGRQLAVWTELLDCDYYRLLEGDASAKEAFRGEYMEQYSWAEQTKGSLLFRHG